MTAVQPTLGESNPLREDPSEMTLAPQIEIVSRHMPVVGTVRPPGSKSYTNRALLIAGLAHGTSKLTGFLDSEDTEVMRRSLAQLGISLDFDQPNRTVSITGGAGKYPASRADLFLSNSGTSIRFLTAACALGKGNYRLDGIPRMRERPIGDLLESLRSLGVDARAELGNECPPVILEAAGIRGGHISVRSDVSSQYLSALLMAVPLAQNETIIEVAGTLVSEPYINMTLAVMKSFGISCEVIDRKRYRFPGGESYQAREYAIEPDASSASYFFAAAALTAGTVTVEGLGKASLQGDLGFVNVLEAMGCTVTQTEDSTTVSGRAKQGIDVDLCHLSDTVPTLAVVAALADSPTRIRNVAHVRKKETDRLAALAGEIRKIGAQVEEFEDGLFINPAPEPVPATFDTYNDHRMAMSLSLLGLCIDGIVVRDPMCTSKTYPEFFGDLAQLTKINIRPR